LEDLLSERGHQVVGVEDGEKALNEIWTHLPDLIILDIMMPKMGGFSIQTELLKYLTTRDIPIIILTAVGRTKDAFSAATNVAAFLEKPFKKEELLKMVDEALLKKPK